MLYDDNAAAIAFSFCQHLTLRRLYKPHQDLQKVTDWLPVQPFGGQVYNRWHLAEHWE